jgi:chitinase
LVLVLGIAAAGVTMIKRSIDSQPASARSATWFAPYADVTLTPYLAFGDTRLNPADTVVLGFVVADHTSHCTPSWGGYYTPQEAATGADLDRRLATLRRRGGQAVVSFGGVANTELAVACTDEAALTKAYVSVLQRYEATTVDLDLEGAALSDVSARTRRAAAIAKAQASFPNGLDVWLTLPVATTGLTADGIATVDAFLAAGVHVSGINVMTMDFGTLTPEMTVADAAIEALSSASAQVHDSFSAAGIDLDASALWAHMGATVMIGRNDVRTEVFNLDNANELLAFAHLHGLGRISLWSINRDAPCGPEVDSGVAQNGCSGVEQTLGAFTQLFAADIAALDVDSDSDSDSPQTSMARTWASSSRTGLVLDDPATAPYPIWNPATGYQGNDKVVWHGNVYQTAWWTQAVQPDAPKANPWDSPWKLVGPVLPTDTAPTTTTIPFGVYPQWNASTAYPAGSRVLNHGAAFLAKWYVIGQEPGAPAANPWDTGWQAVTPTADEIAGITTAVTTTAAITSTPSN